MKDSIKKWQLKFFYSLHIMNQEKTVDYILKNKCSVARFGDGEFGIMLKSQGIGFQPLSEKLADRLLDVIKLGTTNRKLLVCVPSNLNDVSKCSDASRKFWMGWKIAWQDKVVKLIRQNLPKKNYHFGDTQVTRPYMGYVDSKRSKSIFNKLKEIWRERDILIVEGNKSRLGVGNDLFSQAKSIKRILAPSENAFAVYDDILNTVLKNHKKGQVVLLALGPTATVLAADLSKHGIQAIDIGHVDIEYEWFLRGAKTKIPIDGKYVNEAAGGNKVKNIKNAKYNEETIEKISLKHSR